MSAASKPSRRPTRKLLSMVSAYGGGAIYATNLLRKS
ncbi:MAG: hypothetical protein EBR76_03540 [Actinobacteria bacterium]|nr:hypothetical protein [Actinomycetota bacterium]